MPPVPYQPNDRFQIVGPECGELISGDGLLISN